jgi:hypothetical protein
MTRLRPTLAATLAALVFAAPAVAAAGPPHMTAVEVARAQERAYMQQANPGRDLTGIELARAQERTYMQQPSATPIPPRTATAAHGGPSTALLTGSIAAALLLAAAGSLAAITVQRRHAHNAAGSPPPAEVAP